MHYQSNYGINIRLTAIAAIPPIKPYRDRCCSPYSLEEGRSSWKEIKIIIPAITAKHMPNTVSLKKGIKIRYPINAPKGSVRPDNRARKNAFFLFPVAQ